MMRAGAVGQTWLSSNSNEEDDGFDGDLALDTAKPKLKPPSMYRVVLLNDDYTPMEFVVEILRIYFSMGSEQATDVMLAVHTKGKGICGVYPKDIAETKAEQVNQTAIENEHPLMCVIERDE